MRFLGHFRKTLVGRQVGGGGSHLFMGAFFRVIIGAVLGMFFVVLVEHFGRILGGFFHGAVFGGLFLTLSA